MVEDRDDRKVHLRATYGAATCKARTRGVHRRHPLTLTSTPADVTCRTCLYRMLEAGDITDSDPRVTDAMREHLRNPTMRTSVPTEYVAKVHKQDKHDAARATCGSKAKRGELRLSPINNEVTCKTCRGWFPVPERPLPAEKSRP
jgi:hypothetical protein